MRFIFSLLVLLFVGQNVYTHLCMWEPMQRGTFDISSPGAHPCYRKIGPCGNMNSSSSSPRTTLVAGSRFRVHFQQNLNHYYTGKPGSLDVSFAVGLNPAEEDFQVLHNITDYNAMNQITQTNFSAEIMLPNQPCDECVLRVRYLTNNPLEDDHGTTFHQCADVKLTSSLVNTLKQGIKTEKIENKITERQDDPHDCCAPESFITNFFHVIPAIERRSEGTIYYDKRAQLMRVTVSTNGGRGNTTEHGTFDMWMNFTSGYQWYYNRNSGGCDLYGLDYWNDWCFGNKYNQSEDFVQADVRCSSPFQPERRCNLWRNGEFFFEAYATNECLPASLGRPTGERIDYNPGRIGPIDPSIFVPNEACHRETKIKHASPHWMKTHL